MAKKVINSVRGVQKRPLKLRGLALFLISLVFFSSLSVFNTYANDNLLKGSSIQVYFTDDTSVTLNNTYYVSQSYNKVVSRVVCYPGSAFENFSFENGQSANFDIVIGSSLDSTYFDNFQVMRFKNNSYYSVKKVNYKILSEHNISLSADKDNTSMLDYCFVVDYDFTNYPTKTASTSFTVNDVSIDSESKGLFEKLFDKLKGWFDDVGNWFNNIGESIKQWFTNLINNLKTWFENVGKWFSELAEKIKGFFDDLGNKIKGFFENLFNNIKDFFTSLFKPRDTYFDEVRVDLDSFLSEHLGFVYLFPKSSLEMLKNIHSSLKSLSDDDCSLYIHIPSIRFKLFNKYYTFTDDLDYDLIDGVNSINGQPFNRNITLLFKLMNAVIDIVLIAGCSKVLYRKVINKVGVEGGDEL